MIADPGALPAVAVFCGTLVGFSLALIGGGGSMLAMPLLLYVVGVKDPHEAIGTGALAVSLNAFANLIPHARAGHVRWKAAFVFAPPMIIGAWLGSTLGKIVDGKHLVFLFALLMLVVAFLMIRGRRNNAQSTWPKPHMLPRLGAVGFGAGTMAGFFGIGGGFLYVPGLIFASGMSTIYAVGTSLFAVGTSALTTSLSYMHSGIMPEWHITLEFIGGGIVGGWLGAMLAKRLASTRGALNLVFAGALVVVAGYMLWRTWHG
ncbi:sulfite exporter TauE/SafE family protein [Oleiagrimonas sp.]|jgi:uncharacterized membrane protein YfcA|uniref:sulfite exporter TauE/SafE family protein n=1 Tax=Oleiagrimonas sp. TaxID=2010330 RepID=UPI00260EBB16|nr:sulfite exporter TauE/SafE family protein [Oleiagrimonas sp.]MDA3914689.1 sulfite exporter TauE/SafE family protein [Oleiagrimonas sp.]